MKPILKYSLIALAALLLAVPVILVLAVNAGLGAHAQEDRIVFGSKQVEEAITDYVQKRGAPPPTLAACWPGMPVSLLVNP